METIKEQILKRLADLYITEEDEERPFHVAWKLVIDRIRDDLEQES